jgi:hypothetical protein
LKKNTYYTFLISTLSIALLVSIYVNLNSPKKELELRRLLAKSAYSIDRDNSDIKEDLSMVLNYEDYLKAKPTLLHTKKHFDSLETVLKTTDSTELALNLIENIKKKLYFSDTLLNFRRNWCILGDFDKSTSMIEVLEHKPIYKLGETAELNFFLIDRLGFKSNAYEIVDFSPKEKRVKNGNGLFFSIETGKLFQSLIKPVNYEFNYNFVVRNNYINEYDTLYLTKEFTLTP